MTPDALSGWSTAPRSARLAGEAEIIRFFDTAEAALQFLAGHAAVAAAETPTARWQRAYRQRQRDGLVALRVVVPFDQLARSLLETGRLTDRAALDRAEVERAAAQILAEWSVKQVQKYR